MIEMPLHLLHGSFVSFAVYFPGMSKFGDLIMFDFFVLSGQGLWLLQFLAIALLRHRQASAKDYLASQGSDAQPRKPNIHNRIHSK